MRIWLKRLLKLSLFFTLLIPFLFFIDRKKTIHDISKMNRVEIYDRNNESDIDITDNEELVYKLYARKQGTYFVNKVFPEWGMDVLRPDLIERARKIRNYTSGDSVIWKRYNYYVGTSAA